MKLRLLWLPSVLLSLALCTTAQNSASNAASVSVPPVIQFSNVATGPNGFSLSGTVEMTFSLYNNAQGGQALWAETQNVDLDASGHYSVYLGITKSNGLPASLFTNGQAHWLGVTVFGQAEQPRVFLVSVPYAMKAGDAATIGGLPPSAFVLAAPAGSDAASSGASGASGNNSANNPNLGGSGTEDFIPLWIDNNGDLGNSVLFQSGSGNSAEVGINTTSPAATLDVNGGVISRGTLLLPATGTATATQGYNSQPVELQGSAYNSTAGKAVGPLFQLQTEPNGNNTSSPAATLNLLYSGGSGQPSETGLNIASNGLISFAKGQTFPGTGTITGVKAGTGLSGGGTSGTVTLSVNTTFANEYYAQLKAANTFTANQTVNGTVTATGTMTGGELSSSDVVNAANGFELQGTLFDSGSSSTFNAFLGFAGPSTSGSENSASGFQAFSSGQGSANTANGFEALANSNGSNNTGLGYQALVGATGNQNTAVGSAAMNGSKGSYNTAVGITTLEGASTGNYNTALGAQSMTSSVTSGSNNTAVGAFSAQSYDGSQLASNIGNNTFIGQSAGFANGTSLANATAIGANAEVSASNSLVLGAIYGVGTSTNNTAVGIGTTQPAATLDVESPKNSPPPTVNFGNSTNNATFNVVGTANVTGSLTLNGNPITGGGGTITGVTAGTGLSGGGTSGNVTLNNTGILSLSPGTGILVTTGQSPLISIDTTQVPLLNASNNIFNGNMLASSFFSNGLVNAGGGVLSGNGTPGYYLGGNLFAFGSLANTNAFFGFAGNTSTTGTYDMASGAYALGSNTTGGSNTAGGAYALNQNTSGGYNTASGESALISNTSGSQNTATGAGALAENTTGSYNTASGGVALLYNTTGNYNVGIGYQAGEPTNSQLATGSNNTFLGAGANPGTNTAITNATAIGADAQVTTNNSLVLGSIKGVNNAPANTAVGIGTTAPGATLDVEAPSGSTPTVNFGSAANPTNFTVNGNASISGSLSVKGGPVGTITGVSAGTGLSGGGSSGSVTLGLASNACVAGDALTALPFTCSPFATLGANTFTGNQTVNATETVNALIASTDVGIGTSNPASTLDVEGKAAASSAPIVWLKNQATTQSGSTGNAVDIRFTPDGGGAVGTPNAYIRAQEDGNGQYGTSMQFATVKDGGSGASERMRIASTGFVGIGTASPGYPLDVQGGLNVGGTPYALNVAASDEPPGSGNSGPNGVQATGGDGDPSGGGNIFGGDGVDAFGGSGPTAGGRGVFVAGGNASGPGGVGGDGVDAFSGGGMTEGYAGNFNGNLNVTGAIYAGTKDFKIDHPLDPANKYLVHASVESSEMMDIYTGNVTTDVNGEATVHLPDWFEALNRDFRYQLTVIGQFAMAIVSQEIENHQFQIRTNQSHVKVSWQVTAVRQDAYAKAHPLVVEEEKDAKLRGFYIHPELYGAPQEKQIEWARHPQMMKRMKERHQRQTTAQSRNMATTVGVNPIAPTSHP